MPVDDNVLLKAVRGRIGDLLGVDVSQMPHLPVRLTQPGTKAIPAHYEHMEIDEEDDHPDAVALIYLKNGAPRGTGRLIFPLSGIAIDPRPGTMVFFKVKKDDGTLCPHHLHEVEEYSAEY